MDVDVNALEKGREARYAERSFRGTDRKLVKKYFRQDGKRFVVNDRIKGMVDFRQGNVLEATNSGRFDVIFCRNLLIYFTDHSVEKAAQSLHQMLLPCGYLLLGHSESFCRIRAEFSPVRLAGAVAYQKC